MTAKWKVHPFCERFPKMTAEERRETKESISRLGGLTDPIEVWGTKLIDGRHRLELCEELGIDPGRPREWNPPAECRSSEEQDVALWDYLKAKNLHRRHLEKSQRALIAAMDVTTKNGRPAKTPENSGVSQTAAAEQAGVSVDTISAAKTVIEHGTQELNEAVRDGDVAVHDAASVAKESPAVQNAAVKAVKKKKAKTVSKAVKAVKEEENPEPIGDPDPVLDHFKKSVPDELRDVFERCDLFRELMQSISACKSTAKELAQHVSGARLDIDEIERLLTDARSCVRFGMPHTECPKCRRKTDKKCPTCKGTGWISETLLKTSASDADKAWLENRS